MMNEKKVFKKNPDIVSRLIENEHILVPLYRTSEDMDSIYALNETASRVWGLINGKRSILKIKQTLLEEYEVDAKKLDKQLQDLFKDLTAIKAIR